MRQYQIVERRVVCASLRSILALSLFFAITLPLRAQYEVYQWANFEDGQWPSGTRPVGPNFANSVRIVDLTKLPNMPAAFREGIAGSETGRYGLMLDSNPQTHHITGLGVGVMLYRGKLGQHGKALYQADFFIPPTGYSLPSLAVLAMEPPPVGSTEPSNFYRFGITKNRNVYFSRIMQGEATPTVYVQDVRFTNEMPRPGWHRFAIVFDGPETIHCYVDGREPSFSPVTESTFPNLQVGILLADQDNAYSCFVDNMSIQWTVEDVPLPDSPWAGSWTGVTQATVPRPGVAVVQPTQTATAGTPGKEITWYDTDTAWGKVTATQTPMLVYFQAPRIPATRSLEQIFATNTDAQALLGRHVPVKIDVNQLAGGTYAQRFNVFRVPTLIVFDPLGKETARATFVVGDTWDSFKAKLGAK
ncbi:MAG: hypothetical protein V2A74_06485 [bacterium]